MSIIALTEQTFSDVIADNELVVIDFWAEWCGPCKSFEKVIQSVAPKYPKVVFGSVDIESEKSLATDFNISSVPAIMILKNQTVVYADSGTLSASALSEMIDQAEKLDVTSDSH